MGPFRRVPGVKQHDTTDCGAACLSSVSMHYGRRVPIARIRQFAGTDSSGTSVLGMVDAATRLGFTAKGVRGGIDVLRKIPLPAIAHLTLESGLQHYVVVYRVNDRGVLVMDPRDGATTTLSLPSFEKLWTGVLVLLVPQEPFDAGTEQGSAMSRLWGLVRPHRTMMAQALVGAVVYTVLGLATAVYVQKVVDHVFTGGDRGLLNLLSVAMLALVLAQVYIGTMKSLLALTTGQKIDAALILGYHRHLMRLPQTFFDTMKVGEIVARVGDAVKIRAFINDVSLDLLVNALVVTFSVALMMVYHWKLGIVVACVIPLYMAVLWATNLANRLSLRLLMEAAAELEGELVETLGGISTIKRYDLANGAHDNTERRCVRLLRSVHSVSRTTIFSGRATELLSRVVVVVVFWVGGTFVLGGELTPGELMSFYALVGYMTGPATQLVGANRTVQDALIAADRLFEILDLERENEEGVADLTQALAGDVEFRGVSFRYGNRKRVFEDLHLVIPRGCMTAIVGESGCGKSTIAAILQKIYPIQGGSVRIGDLDLKDLRIPSLRRQIAVVPQETKLFAATVLENIALDERHIDMARLLSLCDRLGILDFVRELPLGLETPLGENGVNLSGGQRQRIAVARALYRRAPILVLDEATSHLDAWAEAKILDVVAAARSEGITTIVIAHRLPTVTHADKVVVLGDGRVLEEGTHAALVARGGRYLDLWRAQASDDPNGCDSADGFSTARAAEAASRYANAG